eukprot:jgi/Tetstr1/426340/TSEL_016653.t1
MQARLKALGTSESVLDLAGVSKTDAGQVNARPRVAAKVPVSLYGYVSPGQDPSNPGSVGAPPLSGSAAELRAHSAGCSPSECIVNQDFRDNCLLQRRLATCAVTPHSSGASEDFGNNGVLPNAASELASGRHVLSMTSVEDENVCVSLPIHVWAVKSISVHAEKSVLRRVDGVPDSPVDMSRDGRVQVEDVDSDVIRIERAGNTVVGIRFAAWLSSPPAVAPAQVGVSASETVGVSYIRITALTGQKAFRTQLQAPPAILVPRQSASSDAPLSTQFTASVTLRHDLKAEDDAASLFASLHFSDGSTQDISLNSGLAISPSATTTCSVDIGEIHGLVLQAEVDCSQPMTQPDPMFCPEGAYQRAMLKQYVTHTNVARCGGRIDVASAASFAPLSVQWVQRVSAARDAWLVVPTPGAVTTSGGVPVDIEGQHGGESATRGTLLGSQGERPARPVQEPLTAKICTDGGYCIQVDSTHCSTKPPAPLHPATIAKLQFRPGLQEDIEIATRLKQWWVQSLGGLLIDLLW